MQYVFFSWVEYDPCFFLIQDLSVFNNPDLREVPLTSATVTSTADGMAKLYGILANGGTSEDRVLLTAEQVLKLSTPLVRGTDSVIKKKDSLFGPGTGMILNPKVETERLNLLLLNYISTTAATYSYKYFCYKSVIQSKC